VLWGQDANRGDVWMHEGLRALSRRETEVLRLLLAGHDAKSAATSLGLSVHTVNERLRDARRKLGVSSSREAARLLAQWEQHAPKFLGDKKLAPQILGPKQIGVAATPAVTQTKQRNRGQVGVTSPWLAGGMLVMSLTIAAVALLSTATSSGGAQVPSASASAATIQAMDLMAIADTNGNGSVSADEYDVFSRQGWMFVSQGKDAVRFADLDEVGKLGVLGIVPNAEGFITRQMYHDAIPARFQMLDRNGDNKLSSDELNGRAAQG